MAQKQETFSPVEWAKMTEPKERPERWLPPVGPYEATITSEKIKTVPYIDKETAEDKTFRLLCLGMRKDDGTETTWEISIYDDYTPKSLLGQLYYLAKTWGAGTLVGLRVMVVTTEEKKGEKIKRIYQVFKR